MVKNSFATKRQILKDLFKPFNSVALVYAKRVLLIIIKLSKTCITILLAYYFLPYLEKPDDH